MKKSIVLDTSVLVKFVNADKEKYVENAHAILQKTQAEQLALFAPQLARYEIGNVLTVAEKLPLKRALEALELLHALPITFVSETNQMAFESVALAHRLNITYYDACFLALASSMNATLITDNAKHQLKPSSGISVLSLDSLSIDSI